MPTLTFLDLAYEVLKMAEKPLRYREIWQVAEENGLTTKVKSAGKTPWDSVGAQLYVDVRDNPSSRFAKVGKRPARFILKSRQKEFPASIVEMIDKEELKVTEKKAAYNERNLHPVVSHFAYFNLNFNRGEVPPKN